MTLPEVQRLFRYWTDHPPLGHLVSAIAHALGVKITASKPDPSQHLTLEEFSALMRATGGRIDGLAKFGGG